MFEQDGGLALSPAGLHITRPDEFGSPKAAERARERAKDRPLAPFETMDQQLARVVIRFKRLRDGKPFGKVEEHLFRVRYDPVNEPEGIVAPIPIEAIQHILEKGPNDDGRGFGPIQIESIDFAPSPSHLVPLEELELDEADIQDHSEFPLHNL